MNWQSFFKENKEITAEQASDYIRSRPAGTLQLIDVRQPREYEEGHIPGAILIPLNELPRRIVEIDREREIIVYCRSGVRSTAACQILGDHRIPHVLNLRGGMLQWQGHRVAGGESRGLEYFVQGDFNSAFEMAYRMEYGLKQLYLVMADKTTGAASRELLQYMARLEDGHMARLRSRYSMKAADLPDEDAVDVAEGGMAGRDLAESFAAHLGSQEEIIELAMRLEAQALDLYSRLGRRHSEPALQSFFRQMAEEEQGHLDRLAREMDSIPD
jgi:rhodanese-related sulfurtransferase